MVFPPSESGAVQCPARGRKETTGLVIIDILSTWDSEALKHMGPRWGVTLAQTSETRVSAQFRAAHTVACSEARHGLSVCDEQSESAHVTF